MPKFIIAGDSTAANKSERARPETGWGEKLSWFVSDHYQVINFAKNGASTKSFINDHLLAEAEVAMHKGDYFLIQFGHNDQKVDDDRGTTLDEYQKNLTVYVQTAQKKRRYAYIADIYHQTSLPKAATRHRCHRGLSICYACFCKTTRYFMLRHFRGHTELFQSAIADGGQKPFLAFTSGGTSELSSRDR